MEIEILENNQSKGRVFLSMMHYLQRKVIKILNVCVNVCTHKCSHIYECVYINTYIIMYLYI
jgi:hypothetical protein